MDKRKYLVTRVETITVFARSEDEARLVGMEGIAYGWPDTTDVEVEVVNEVRAEAPTGERL